MLKLYISLPKTPSQTHLVCICHCLGPRENKFRPIPPFLSIGHTLKSSFAPKTINLILIKTVSIVYLSFTAEKLSKFIISLTDIIFSSNLFLKKIIFFQTKVLDYSNLFARNVNIMRKPWLIYIFRGGYSMIFPRGGGQNSNKSVCWGIFAWSARKNFWFPLAPSEKNAIGTRVTFKKNENQLLFYFYFMYFKRVFRLFWQLYSSIVPACPGPFP